MTYFRSIFKEVVFNPLDTLHFGPDDYNPDSYDSAITYYLYDVLQNSLPYGCEVGKISFGKPHVRGKLNGQEIFIAEFGDTSNMNDYYGKELTLYVWRDKIGWYRSLSLARAQQEAYGAWQQTDSWFIDMNMDGEVDIISRTIGQYEGLADTTGTIIKLYDIDEMNCVTLHDTGFVKLPISNPDSLRKIYKNYRYKNHHNRY